MKKFKYDYYRMIGSQFRWRGAKHILLNPALLYMFVHRKITDEGKRNLVYRYIRRHIMDKYGLEILSPNIGEGFFINHPYAINVNESAIIGKNVNIHKGVTIGQENRGKRKGAPVIGDCVWIGMNATIVGKITIGDDVLIAPNSFVNINIPSHSVVLGAPCQVFSKPSATESYINRKI